MGIALCKTHYCSVWRRVLGDQCLPLWVMPGLFKLDILLAAAQLSELQLGKNFGNGGSRVAPCSWEAVAPCGLGGVVNHGSTGSRHAPSGLFMGQIQPMGCWICVCVLQAMRLAQRSWLAFGARLEPLRQQWSRTPCPQGATGLQVDAEPFCCGDRTWEAAWLGSGVKTHP